MEIIRVHSAKIVQYIEPHLTFTDPELKELFVEDLMQQMISLPGSILLLAAIEDEEVKAFVIARDPGYRVPFAQVAQLWSDPDNPREIVDQFFIKVISWALALGKTYIRAETSRDPAAFYRRFKFKPELQIMRFNLDTEEFQDTLHKHSVEFLQWATSSTQEPKT